MHVNTTTRGRRRGAVRLGAIAAVAALVAVSCGDDDGGSDDSGESADTEAPAATEAPADTEAMSEDTEAPEATEAPADTEAMSEDTEAPADTEASDDDGGGAADGEPVLIIGLIDQTGPSPTSVGTEAVLDATVQSINENGGLNGHPIEFEIVDTAGDPATAITAVAETSGQNPLAYVLSTPATETATGEDLAAVGVPIMGVGYSPSVWGGSAGPATCESDPEVWCAKPNHFTITTTFSAVVSEQVLGAQAAGATNLAVAACAEVDSCASAVPVFEGVADALGLTYSGTTRVSSVAPDYSAECIAWIQDGVDFIQISGSSAMGVNLMASCNDQGYDGIWGASAGTVSGDLIQQPYTLAGGLNAFPWWVDDEPVVAYRDAMDAAGVSEGDYSGPTQTGLYSSLLLLQKAINDYADPDATLDGAAALAAMYQVSDESLDGLIVPVSYSEDDLDRTRDCFWPYIKDPENNFTNPAGGLTYQCFPPQ